MLNFNKIAVSGIVSICLALSGCGGGDDNDLDTLGNQASSNDTQVSLAGVVSLTGKVADGYLQNATVCLDLNGNKACDSDEPSATTDANGDYTIKNLSQADIDKYPVIVKVIAGTTIDSDYGTTPLAKSYTMSAPPGKGEFISPLTTMVQTQLESKPNSTVEQVESQLLTSMGQTDEDVSLFTDYVAEGANANNEDASDYDLLHKLAQVTATTISTQIEAAEAAVTLSPEQFDALIQIVVSAVIEEIPSIINAVDTDTGTDYSNPDDIVSLSTSVGVEINTTTLEEDLAVVQIAETATSADFASFIEDGFNWFEAGRDDEDLLWVDHGKVTLDTSNNMTTETAYEYNFDTSEFEVITESINGYFLTPTGWVDSNESLSSDTMIFNSDGSATVTDSATGEEFSMAVHAVDITGLNIKSFLMNVANNGELHQFVNNTAAFSDGATAYELFWSKLTDYYSIPRDTECQELTTLEGNCNWAHKSDGAAYATQLSELIVETTSVINQHDGDDSNDFPDSHTYWLGTFEDCDTDPQTFDEMCHASETLDFQLVGTGTSGTVNFYLSDYLDFNTDSGGNKVFLLATGTWDIKNVHGRDLLMINIPTSLRNSFGHIMEEIIEPEEQLFFTVHNGYVRMGNYVPADTDGAELEMLFDNVTAEDIKSAKLF